ncbi:MAG: prolipoprotein diacylglyceryl transferase [Actinomycetota bacterium]|nr:prolipoprotein diacylglyceryl transferase [Actinomycetota bacterium]
MLVAGIAYDPLLRIPLGPLEVSPHGIGIAVGVLVGARLAVRAAAQRGIDAERFYDVLTWALFGALLGARLAYVVNHLGDYLDDPLAVVRVWEGGFSLLGGLAGSVVAGYPKLRAYRIPFWRYLDPVVPGIALGIAVGRIGDLVIADHLGKPTEFVLGYVCPEVETGSRCLAPVGEAVHQTALYDLVGAALVFVLLSRLARRPRPEAFLAAVFGLTYGIVRIVEGFFRVDVTHGTGLNGSQWTALAVVVASAVALVVRRDVEPAVTGDGRPGPAVPAHEQVGPGGCDQGASEDRASDDRAPEDRAPEEAEAGPRQ